MINIDDVYQKVLSIANKEQRGYITPQEFNLMADKAQMEIFDLYFYDMKNAYQKPKNDSVYSDELEMLSEKLQIFRAQSLANDMTDIEVGTGDTIPTSVFKLSALSVPMYRLDTLVFTTPDGYKTELVEMTRKERTLAENNPLTKATLRRPTYVREGGTTIRIAPVLTTTQAKLTFHYWRRPAVPKWAYVVVNQKALYNYANSINFELHPSEEEKLVTRILEMSGITIRDASLSQAANADKINTKTDQLD
jgi:hypothetical protein